MEPEENQEVPVTETETVNETETETETDDNLQTFTFPTSTGGISFSLRPIQIPVNSVLMDPIFSFLPLNRLGGGAAPMAGANVLNNSLYDKESYKHVLSDEGKKQITYRPFDKEKDEVKKCPIMFTNFEHDEEIAELPCGHIFDKDGISKWLEEEEASCPVCRKKLDSKEIKNEDEDDAPHPTQQLPTLSNLIRTYRQRSMAIIDDAEERMMQMAIEQSLRE